MRPTAFAWCRVSSPIRDRWPTPCTRPTRRSSRSVSTVRRIVATASEHGPRRLIYLSALGVGDGRRDAGLLFRALIRPIVLRGVYADHVVKEGVIEASGLEWTVVRPNNLTGGAASGRYRVGPGLSDRFPIGFLSRADLAEVLLDAACDAATINSTVNVVG